MVEENPLMETMGVERAKKTDFGKNLSRVSHYVPDGNGGCREGTPEERAEHLHALEYARREAVVDEWQAEMTPRSIKFRNPIPTRIRGKAKLVCGCGNDKEFEATLQQLSRLPREDPRCPMCPRHAPMQELGVVVGERGGTLLTPYRGAHRKVELRCAYGHRFAATPANIIHSNSWCPHCYVGSGKRKLEEALAVHGCTLTDYGKYASAQKKGYIDVNGVDRQKDHSTLLNGPPICTSARGEQPVRVFFDEDRGYFFVLAGDIPPILPRLIAEIVNLNDMEMAPPAKNRGDVRRAVTKAIEANKRAHNPDFVCVNVLWNDDWESPGRYAWGNIDPFHGTLVDTNTLQPAR